MSKRLVSASLTAAALALAPLASAKPPDLPADVRDTCAAGQDIPGIPVSREAAPAQNTPQSADPINAYLIEAVSKFCLASVPALGGVPVFALDNDFYDPEEALRVETSGAALGATVGATVGSVMKPPMGVKVYRVRAADGEGLYQIAEKTLRDGRRWSEIYRLNPSLTPEAPIPAGTMLLLPGDANGPAAASQAVEENRPEPQVDPIQHDHARSMYLIGERCRRRGDLDMAQNCYEETRRLCPNSPYAAKAIAKLRQVQASRDAEAGTESSESTENREPRYISLAEAIELAKQGEADRKLALLKQRTETRNLYFIGERCREGGDAEMARRCYEQAVQLGADTPYGRKCRDRLQAMDANHGGEETSEPVDPLAAPTKKRSRRPKQANPWLLQTKGSVESPAVCLCPVLPAIDHLIAQAFDRVLAAAEQPSSGLMIVPEKTQQAAGEEESEPGSGSWSGFFRQTAPATLYVETPPRDLVVRTEPLDGGEVRAAPVDLSDWLRDSVRLMNGAGTLKIDASRLGRLLSKGTAAVRALGCEIVEDSNGNRYVVYPARR